MVFYVLLRRVIPRSHPAKSMFFRSTGVFTAPTCFDKVSDNFCNRLLNRRLSNSTWPRSSPSSFRGTVPITNRNQLVIIPRNVERRMGEDQLKWFKENHKLLPPSHPTAERANKILHRLMEALGRKDVDVNIEIILVDNNEKNFYTLTGGYI